MAKNYLIYILPVLIFLTSCQEHEEYQTTSITGEIIEPESPYVIFSGYRTDIDTAFLNRDNRFHFKFSDTLEDGFYSFRHDYDNYYESQIFYIEKGDSLKLLLNTHDFDHSLMYSGDGAEANNFLMEVFLDYQNNKDWVSPYIRGNVFLEVTDSIKKGNQQKLDQLKKEQKEKDISDDFIANIADIMNYGYYDLFEVYYYHINRMNNNPKTHLQRQLPEDFLDYRKAVDLNKEQLQSYYTYQIFVQNYINNKVIESCLEAHAKDHPDIDCFKLNSKHHLRKALEYTDENLEIESLRSRFFTHYGAKSIYRAETAEEVDSIYDFLMSRNKYNPADKKDIEQLAQVQTQQFTGNISTLNLTSPNKNHEDIALSSIVTRSTIFYYWSVYYKNLHQEQHAKIKELKEKFPELNFIGINIDNEDPENWVKSLENFEYSDFDEYQLICAPDQRNFYRNIFYLENLTLTDAEGEIINARLDFKDEKLEEKIQNILKKLQQK